MPRLPDPYSEQVQVPRPITGITPQPNTGVADAAAAGLGQQITQIGTQVIPTIADRRDQVAASAGETALLRGHVAAMESFKENQNYPEWQKQYEDQQSQILQDSASKITNPRIRQQFIETGQRGITEGSFRVHGEALSAEKDRGRAWLQDTLNGNNEAVTRSQDPQVRAALLQANQNAIASAESMQWISHEDAVNHGRASAIQWARDAVSSMPPAQIAGFEVGKKTGTPFDFLPGPEARSEIQHAQGQMRIAATADRVNTDYAYTQQKRQQAEYDSSQQDQITHSLINGADPQTVISSLGKDKSLSYDATMRMMHFAETFISKPDKEASASAVSHAITVQTLEDMRRPEGDPRRINTTDQLYDRYNGGQWGNTDFSFAKGELLNRTGSPDDTNLSARQKLFMDKMAPSITKSNPLLGVTDMTGGNEQLYHFEYDVAQAVAQARKDGKNPFDLFNPSSPAYLGSPENMAQYQLTYNQSSARVAAATARDAALNPPPPVQPGFWQRIFGTSEPVPETPTPAPATAPATPAPVSAAPPTIEPTRQAAILQSLPHEGLVEPGNIKSIFDRPILHNPDGSYSTTKSMSFETSKGETLVPTVVNGKLLTQQQAIDHYKQTGEHLGIFDTPGHADAYAEALHNAQAAYIEGKPSAAPPTAPLTRRGIMDEAQAAKLGFPTFNSPSDPVYVALPKGSSYRNGFDGKIMIKK